MEQRDPVHINAQPSADELRTTRETLEQLGAPDENKTHLSSSTGDSTLTAPGEAEHNTTSGLDMAQSPAAPLPSRSLDDSAANDPF